MSEMKKIRVREAKARDLGLFRKLWGVFLEEQLKKGAKVAASEQSMELYETLFNNYVSGHFDGAVLLIADKAVLMWGDAGTPVDYTVGKIATAWGFYVEPGGRDEEMRKALESRAIKALHEKGFAGVVGSVFQVDVDELEEAWQPVSLVVYRSLEADDDSV